MLVGVLSLIGVIYTSKKSQSKNEALIEARISKMEEITAMHFKQIEERIDNLSILQTKHNNLMERVFQLEKSEAETSRDVKTLYNTADEMKSDIRDVRNSIDIISQHAMDYHKDDK